jgi:hypothetical protein
MSSESNGHKSDSAEPGPPSGKATRVSARVPSTWGAARDALAAVHNLEALLRSGSVPHRTILDLLPELRSGAGVLRAAFEGALAEGPATSDVGRYGGARLDELEELFDSIAPERGDREALANRARSVADDLESSADLLGLLERASAPVLTDVSIDLIVRETGRTSASGHGQELVVRFDEALPDCVVATDPYVVGPLLAVVVGCVHRAGGGTLVLRARCEAGAAMLIVETATPADAALPPMAIRVMPSIVPAEAAARQVAEHIGAPLEIAPTRWSLRLARVPG